MKNIYKYLFMSLIFWQGVIAKKTKIRIKNDTSIPLKVSVRYTHAERRGKRCSIKWPPKKFLYPDSLKDTHTIASPHELTLIYVYTVSNAAVAYNTYLFFEIDVVNNKNPNQRCTLKLRFRYPPFSVRKPWPRTLTNPMATSLRDEEGKTIYVKSPIDLRKSIEYIFYTK